MIAVAQRKIKYNGQIRRAYTPFVANNDDRALLASWGCTFLDEFKQDSLQKDKFECDEPGEKVECTSNDSDNQPTPSPKKTRKRKK